MGYVMSHIQIGVSLPAETLADLDRYAAEYGYTRSQAARQLIRDGLALVAHDGSEVQAELARSAA
jgi:metal-responsive CopG/Arc/MetJ family transcriptional regulator